MLQLLYLYGKGLWYPLNRGLGRSQSRTGRLDKSLGRSKSRTGRLDKSLCRSQRRTGRLDRSLGRSKSRTGRLDRSLGRLQSRTGLLDRNMGRSQSRTGRFPKEENCLVLRGIWPAFSVSYGSDIKWAALVHVCTEHCCEGMNGWNVCWQYH